MVISGAVNADASPHVTEQIYGLSVASSSAPCPSGKRDSGHLLKSVLILASFPGPLPANAQILR